MAVVMAHQNYLHRTMHGIKRDVGGLAPWKCGINSIFLSGCSVSVASLTTDTLPIPFRPWFDSLCGIPQKALIIRQ